MEITPAGGGKLMAGMSSETAGIANYTSKVDMRRYLDRECRAEGHIGYQPNQIYSRAAQSIPPNSGGPISLISEVELGDGRVILIAGNQTTLWRAFGTEALAYFDAENSSTEFDAEAGQTYYDETAKGWIQIGSGFSPLGKRWEAVRVGDFVVLNNGYDLPMTYRLDQYSVYPIYELREQQVASVATIGAMNDILICMGLKQIFDTDFTALMQPIAATVAAAQDATGLVTPLAATLFPSIPAAQLPGMTLFWASEQRLIKSVDANGFIHVNNDQLCSGTVTLENPAAYAAWTGRTDNFLWRVLPSMPSLPRRFGSIVTASMFSGGRVVEFDYPVRSFSDLFYSTVADSIDATGFPEIFVPGAALNGGNLISQMQWIPYGSARSMQLQDTCETTVGIGDSAGDTVGIPIEAADAQDSFAGEFVDLVDDGSAILCGVFLNNSYLIFKEPSPHPAVFIGTYDGVTPFQFQKVALPNTAQAPHYKNVIIAEGGGFYGSHVIYAGRNAFYKFDLFQMTPTEIPALTACQTLFFDKADRDLAFVAENPLTRELVFCYGDGSGALCYDYAQGTCRTTTAAITAAGKSRHPVTGADWFVLGMSDGSVKRYGLLDQKPRQSGVIVASTALGKAIATASFFTPDDVGTTLLFADGNLAAVDSYINPVAVGIIGLTGPVASQTFTILPGIWHRDGTMYNSILEAGMDKFGAGQMDKILMEYSLIASSESPDAAVQIDFRGGNNPKTGVNQQTAIIQQPTMWNKLQPTVMAYYISDRATVSGIGPFEITGRTFLVRPINSHGY